MCNFDRFGGPAAWDRYCMERDEARERLLKNSTCGECGHCAEPPDDFENPGRIGYCKECGEFVCLDDVPHEIGCEEFE